MASIISAGTTDSTSLNVSGDKTGILQLASNNAVTAVTIDASQNVGIGTSNNNVFDQVGNARPFLVQKSDTSTTIAGSLASITISNGDTTTNNTSQINFATITGASTNQYSAATISAVFGARTNGQYPTGQLVFSTSTSLNVAPTEKMRIDNSGNVGIGTSSPSTYGKLCVLNSSGATTQAIVSAPTAQYTGSGLLLSSTTASTNYGSTFLSHQYTSASNDTTNYVFNISLRNATGGYVSNVYSVDYKNQLHQWYNPVTAATSMTLDISGNLLVGTTTPFTGTKISFVQPAASTVMALQSTGSDYAGMINFYAANGTIKGSVGATPTTVAYNTSSDYRLKDNIAPMTSALATVAKLKPVTYTWKVNGSNGQGFIAHELQEVVPDCVTGEKDAVDEEGNIKPQGIDTSFLVATLTAAIQELKAINDTQAETINALTARIEALENK
jgi:hypothetical protein